MFRSPDHGIEEFNSNIDFLAELQEITEYPFNVFEDQISFDDRLKLALSVVQYDTSLIRRVFEEDMAGMSFDDRLQLALRVARHDTSLIRRVFEEDMAEMRFYDRLKLALRVARHDTSLIRTVFEEDMAEMPFYIRFKLAQDTAHQHTYILERIFGEEVASLTMKVTEDMVEYWKIPAGQERLTVDRIYFKYSEKAPGDPRGIMVVHNVHFPSLDSNGGDGPGMPLRVFIERIESGAIILNRQ